jgi:hypothetical protein
MHQALTDVVARLDRTRHDLRAIVETIPGPLRERRPGPDRWSVAEIVEHLALVETQYTAIVREALAKVRARGLSADGSARQPLPDTLESLMANRSAQRPAPEPFKPTGIPFEAAWAQASEVRTTFRTLLEGADDVAFHEALYDHPRFGVLNAYQWVEFVAAH